MTQKRENRRAVVTESRNWKYFTQSQLNKKLLLACTFRDASTAERAIVHGADVNCRRSDFMTPLHIAAEHDDIELVRVLCKPHDVNLEAKTMHGLTPMHTAALLGHTRVMRDLLKFGATASCTDNLQRTPLHYAALHSNLDCARYLIKAGSGIHVYDVFQESPLHISVLKTRNLPMTKLFLAHRFRRSSFTPRDAQCLLFHAVLGARDRSDVEMIDMILHYGGSNVVNAFDPIGRRTPLHIVAMTGYYELAECAPPVLRRRESQRHFFPYTSRPYRFLIDRGADLGAKNRAEQTPMQAALNCKNLNVVRLIQDRSRAMGDG